MSINFKSYIILKTPVNSNVFIYLLNHFKLEHVLSSSVLRYLLSPFFQLGQ